MKAELQQIIRALQNAAELIPYAKNDPSDPSNSLGSTAEASPQSWIRSVNEVADEVQAAISNIAALDKLEAQPPAKVLTDKVEITSRMVMGKWVPQFRIDNQTFSLEPFAEANDAEWYCDMLRKAFDKLAPAPFPVDEVMEIYHEWRGWFNTHGRGTEAKMSGNFRARLAAKFNTPKP